jgi:2-oxoisovalerate dehydrogenase E2 component (dihydrolipoyl transacylase)
MTERVFLLPDLGEGLEEAEVVTWRVAEGDGIELNQPLVEVDTAKALVEIPSPFAGRVIHLHAGEGDVVNVGTPLVTVEVAEEGPAEPVQGPETADAPGEVPAEETRPRRRAVLVGYGVEDEEPPTATGAAPTGSERPPTGDGSPRTRTSPPVRRLARDLGVDLATVTATGSEGRVTREDVQRAAAAGTEAAEPSVSARPAADTTSERVPVRGPRRLIAERMTRSVQEIPQVTTFLTVDATDLEGFRDDLRSDPGERVSPLPIVVRALVEVCRLHPKLNATFDAGASEIVLYRSHHIGIATDTDRGLLVPVVKNADRLGILELSREIARLVQAARSASATPDDLAGGTITVTNVGTFGAEFGTPIINPPQAAILALGVIEPRALVVEGRVEARPAATLSLTFDHRLLDGAEAGRALRALADLLESPFRLGALPR